MTPETGNSVAFDTAKVVLVPLESYRKGEEGDYLRFNGMAPADGEVAVASEECDGIVAVMAVPQQEWRDVSERFERGEVRVTSPLLSLAAEEPEGRRRKKREVCLHLTDENIYLTVWDSGLRMAEAMPDNTADSILYYMQMLERRFELRRFRIWVSGTRTGLARETASMLSEYYRRVSML